MAISDIEKAIRDRVVQTTIDAPQSQTLTITTANIISSAARDRTVFITNVGAVDAFLSLGENAVNGKGISLLAGESKIIPLDNGVTLEGLSSATTTDVAWQSFGG